MIDYKEKLYPESQFGGFTNVDGTISFYTRVNALLQSSFTVLDVGCGRGAYKEDLIPIRKNIRVIKGKVKKVIGIDADVNAQGNPFVDEFRLLQNESWPVEQDSIDLIVCDNVLEHIKNPITFFYEARRVLKNQGYLCVRTPNKWNYIAFLARFIPDKYHSKMTNIVQIGRKENDVFPTLYKCNSLRRIKKLMAKNGFESAVYGYESEPCYLSFSKLAYRLGVLHQRYAPGFMKAAIFAFGKVIKSA